MSLRKFVKMFIPKSLFKKIEPFGHKLEAIFFNTIYGFPARNIRFIGVTGTNGKTTTSFMIHKMMNNAGIETGLMTTVAWGGATDIKPQIQHMTNVTVPEMMKRLKYLKKLGVKWIVLETTSQGLAQNRVWGIPYEIAVMTNITHEHLDYHGTFENYRGAKVKLFKIANKRGLRTGIINADDENAQYFESVIKNPITYGEKKGDLRAKAVELGTNGSKYVATYGTTEYEIRCNIPGSFNVYNSMAAVCVGITLGLNPKQITEGIAALENVEGRMTRITQGQNFDVIVDFAHTPDSFEKLFKDLKPVVKGKLIVMFGSAGRRDETKRAIQGELAGKYADEVVLTEEDDRDIDGNQILEQIAQGAIKTGKTKDKDLFLVLDRTEAIKFVIGRAAEGDTVLLLGKGHEKTIERANGENPWDEIGTAKNLLKK
ncbi:MAG: UDP-N-acetylmuramyl-tripeptide synthetase [bacterium]|nr:UDP-N-acetylmuramyl-tripeptide synthetase [bacterium]